jgi:hypothetical protein
VSEEAVSRPLDERDFNDVAGACTSEHPPTTAAHARWSCRFLPAADVFVRLRQRARARHFDPIVGSKHDGPMALILLHAPSWFHQTPLRRCICDAAGATHWYGNRPIPRRRLQPESVRSARCVSTWTSFLRRSTHTRRDNRPALLADVDRRRVVARCGRARRRSQTTVPYE